MPRPPTITAAAAIVAALLAAHVLGARRRLLGRRARLRALDRACARAEARLLERQLEPHFLFNALSVAAELARVEPARARRVLRELAALLRGATATHAVEVPLGRELALLAPFVAMQHARFGDGVRIETSVAPEAAGLLVPPLVLQPLVENAVAHGGAARTGRARIRILADVVAGGERLRLRVVDDGGGRPPAARAGWLGLRNTADRLRALHGDAALVTMQRSVVGETVAEVLLPARAARPPATRDVAAAPAGSIAALDRRLAEGHERLRRARWRTRTANLPPRLLLAVLERAAELAPSDPAAAEAIVERLAEAMRLVMAARDEAHVPLPRALECLERVAALVVAAGGPPTRLDVALGADAASLAAPIAPPGELLRALAEQVDAGPGAAPRLVRLALVGGVRAPELEVRASFPICTAPRALGLPPGVTWQSADGTTVRVALRRR